MKQSDDGRRAVTLGVLFALMVLGAWLRTYHLDDPPIGYHNMKESEYLSQAVNQLRHGDYLRRRQHILGLQAGVGYFEEYPQLPLLPWMFVALWHVVGVHVWVPRLVIVGFSLATVPLVFLVTRRLGGSRGTSLLAAAIFTVMPLTVYFGRNIQPDSPALCCVVLGTSLFLGWREDRRVSTLALSVLAFAVAGLFKSTFLIGLLPVVTLWPAGPSTARRPARVAVAYAATFAAVAIAPSVAWAWASTYLNTTSSITEGIAPRIAPFAIFTPSWWGEHSARLGAFVSYGITWWFLGLALYGIVVVALSGSAPLRRFVFGATVAVVPYGMLVSDFVGRHSYYLLPLVPLVCLASAHAVDTSVRWLRHDGRWRWLRHGPLLVMLAAVPAVRAGIAAEFDVVFFGLDVSADYLKRHSAPDDRFYLAGGPQSVGICVLADRRCGFIGFPRTVDEFVFGEEHRHMRWLVVHAAEAGFQALTPDVLVYVHARYVLRQLTYLVVDGRAIPQTLVLERGGVSDLEDLARNDLVRNRTRHRSWERVYDMTNRSVRLVVIER